MVGMVLGGGVVGVVQGERWCWVRGCDGSGAG